MSKVPVFVGLDYHSVFIQVCVVDRSGKVLVNRRVDNCWRSVVNVVHRYGRPEQVALEACCGAANLADELRQKAEWPVDLAHPGYVARMKGNPDKTDFADSHLLADLSRVGYLPIVWLAPEHIRELRRLIRFRDQLVKERRNAKLRIRGFLREHRLRAEPGTRAWTKAWRAWLDEQKFSDDDRWILDSQLEKIGYLDWKIKETEKRLKTRAAKDRVVQVLMGIEGVGLITAMTLRAEIGNFSRFDSGKKLARFCSVTPRNASSGDRQADSGLVKAGSALLRSVLIETAHRLAWRMDTQWSSLAERLLKKGKPKNVVVAAIANRWTRWLYHQVREEAVAA